MWPPHESSPVLLIDEAQEMSPDVLSELRILSSADFDATSLLTVVLSGDGRLLELLRHEDLVPLGTRIRSRLVTEAASREELLELLKHALAKAGNADAHDRRAHGHLGRSQRRQLPPAHDHGAELLAYGMAHEVTQLDEKFTWKCFSQGTPAPRSKRKRGV
jgi:general secretion pathway protein A